MVNRNIDIYALRFTFHAMIQTKYHCKRFIPHIEQNEDDFQLKNLVLNSSNIQLNGGIMPPTTILRYANVRYYNKCTFIFKTSQGN